MDALFLVDRHARERQMSVEERLALRREPCIRLAAAVSNAVGWERSP